MLWALIVLGIIHFVMLSLITAAVVYIAMDRYKAGRERKNSAAHKQNKADKEKDKEEDLQKRMDEEMRNMMNYFGDAQGGK